MSLAFPLQLTEKGELTIIIVVSSLIALLIIFSFVGYFKKKKKDKESILAEQEEQRKIKQEIEDYKNFIRSKYNSEDSEKLLSGMTWNGMTKEMLLDLYGNPSSSENKDLKTKSQEILIYKKKNPSTRRYVNNKFIFEDDILVSSDVKARPFKIWEVSGFRFN